MGEKYDGVLLLDEENYPILIEEECANLKPIIKDFMSFWAENKDKPAEVWLPVKLQEHLPEKPVEEIGTEQNGYCAHGPADFFHGAARYGVHDYQCVIQHCGQHFRGAVFAECAGGGLAGVPAADAGRCDRRRHGRWCQLADRAAPR